MDNEMEQEFLKAFGKHIRDLRRQRKMSQEQLSVHIGITVVSVSHLERGVHAPTFNKLGPLANAFGIEVWELFQGLAKPQAVGGKTKN